MKKKTDNDTVSKEDHEARHIARYHKIPIKVVRSAVAQAGASRDKVYELLRAWGYNINLNEKDADTPS